eukprot:362014-Chlamydomonas_euryale.AAC.5
MRQRRPGGSPLLQEAWRRPPDPVVKPQLGRCRGLAGILGAGRDLRVRQAGRTVGCVELQRLLAVQLPEDGTLQEHCEAAGVCRTGRYERVAGGKIIS